MMRRDMLGQLLASACWVLLISARATAGGPVVETETNGSATNNTRASAQVIPNATFTVDPNPTIFTAADGGLAGTAITATVVGRTGGGFSTDVDFYQFQMLNSGYAWFDIDSQRNSGDPDTTLNLFNSAGTLIAQNDDSFFDMNGDGQAEADPGSTVDGGGTLDSFIGEIFLTAGTYYVGIGEYSNFATGGGVGISTPQPTSFFPVGFDFWASITGAAVGNSSFNASGPQLAGTNYVLQISQIAIPEPAALTLVMLGATAMVLGRRCRR